MITINRLVAFLSLVLSSQSSLADDLKTAINPSDLPDTLMYGFSQATVAAANSRIVYIAGQTGFTDGGPNDFETQVERAFDALEKALAAAGATSHDVVKITLLISDYDASKLAFISAKRRATFGVSPPASTLIPVPALYAPGVLFEIDAVAVVGNQSS